MLGTYRMDSSFENYSYAWITTLIMNKSVKDICNDSTKCGVSCLRDIPFMLIVYFTAIFRTRLLHVVYRYTGPAHEITQQSFRFKMYTNIAYLPNAPIVPARWP